MPDFEYKDDCLYEDDDTGYFLPINIPFPVIGNDKKMLNSLKSFFDNVDQEEIEDDY